MNIFDIPINTMFRLNGDLYVTSSKPQITKMHFGNRHAIKVHNITKNKPEYLDALDFYDAQPFT